MNTIKDSSIKSIKKDIILFFILFGIACLVYWNYISMHYATDTYNIINMGYTKYAIEYSLCDGRVVMFIIGILAEVFAIPIQGYVIGLTLIAIVISCIAVICLKNMICSIKKTKSIALEVLLTTICYTVIFHFLYIENLYFVESVVMALSVLLYILAVKIWLNKQRYFILKTIALVVIATFCYQGTIGFFVLLSFVLLLLQYPKQYKLIAKQMIGIIGVTVLAFLSNILQITLITNILNLQQQRINGIGTLLQTAKQVFFQFKFYIGQTLLQNSCYLFPKNYFIAFLGSFLGLTVVFCLKYKKKTILGETLAICVLTIGICYAMCVISIASFDTGRIYFPLGALLGLLFLYLYARTDIFDKDNKMQYFYYFLFFVYVIILIVNTSTLLNIHKQVNKKEEQLGQAVKEYVQNYENETGKEIQQVKIYKIKGKKQEGFFAELQNQSVLAYNGAYCTWSAIGMINYYTNHSWNADFVTIQEEQEKYLQYETLKIEGIDNNFIGIENTLYFSVYI